MPRKGTAEPDDLLRELPGTEEEGGEGGEGGGGNGSAAAEVAVRGKGRTVADALKKAGLKGQAKDLKGKFNDLLKNPTNKIVASRIFPRTMRGPDGKSRDCSDTVDLPPPMSLEEIITHLREEFGGKKWNITVMDEDGEVIDRRNVDVPGEPKYNHRPEDDFQIPDLDDLTGGEDKEAPVEDVMDREIAHAEKQSRLLMVERQNAQLKAQLAEARGDSHKKNGEVPVADQIKAALAEQEARHRAEIAEREKKSEMENLERRMSSDADRRFNELKAMIESVKAGNPAQSTALSDLGHKLELLQTSIDTKIKDALSSYRETTNMQINALEKALDGKVTAIQTAITTMQNRPHDPDPLKSVVPLIQSSIERSTSGYKELMGPLINHMTAKQEAEAVQSNPLEDTLETLGKFNLLGDRKSGDFGSRVVDFAEKMAPEIISFVREEKRAGREVTEAAIKNHLKLQAEKISRDVSAAAAQEIKKIRQESQPRHALPAPAQPPAQTVSHQGNTGPSPVGRITPEEAAARARQETPRPAAPAPAAPAAAPSAAPAPAAPPRPAQQQVQPPQPPPAADEEVEEEEEEDEPELTVEEEMAARVNSTLGLLEREMKVRPRNITWPNAAWDDLPGEVLDQIIFANDEEDVYNAIKPYADPELAERVWAVIRADAKAKDFIVNGINIIKGWAVELQQKQRAAQGGGEAAPPPAAPEAPAVEGQ